MTSNTNGEASPHVSEDLVHFIWKHQLFNTSHLQTTEGEDVQIIKTGYNNTNAGPDFLQASIKIADKEWHGAVEIHIHSSDWRKHRHHTDPTYEQVILHVVYQHDADTILSDHISIPTLELQPAVSPTLLKKYSEMMSRQLKIPCSHSLPTISSSHISLWVEQQYIRSLEQKCKRVKEVLAHTAHDWAWTTFVVVARAFGLSVNADAFESMARSLPWTVILKVRHDQLGLEALLMGIAGLLTTGQEDEYRECLREKFEFYQHKFKLTPSTQKVKFARMRPPNFPTIRLSQLATLYTDRTDFFQNIIMAENLHQLESLFSTTAHEYWDSHFTFGKETSASKARQLSTPHIHLVLINAIIPILFAYHDHSQGESHWDYERLLSVLRNLPPESNHCVQAFEESGLKVNDGALATQALTYVYKNDCSHYRCLQCSIGYRALKE